MALSALETTRDIVVIIWGILSILAFVFLILFLLSLWRGIKDLLGTVKIVVNEDVRPIIATSRESVNNVTGTTRFLSDTVAQPVIRVLGLIAYARRFLSVFAGVTGRKRRDKAGSASGRPAKVR